MKYVIFDIDGTLTQSTNFDASCFKNAVLEHADVVFKEDWGEYEHVTDSGILSEIIRTHGLIRHEIELTKSIKNTFIRNIETHLSYSPVNEVPGANEFLGILASLDGVSVAIATGGWGETAKLKLGSAGIDFENVPLCSANDAISRVDIMTLAKTKAGVQPEKRITYFGDAAWDKKACSDLGWNFVLVGNRIEHSQRIATFYQKSEAMQYCIL